VQKGVCGPKVDIGLCAYGNRSRSCNSICQWAVWSTCFGAVYPSAEKCGNGKDEDCDGKDKTAPDTYEPNNTCSTCKWLGTDIDKTLYGTFDHVGNKYDYYCFDAVDNFNLPFTSESIEVKLSKQAIGMDGDLHLYRGLADCKLGQKKALAKSVTIGGKDEELKWKETDKDDKGFYIVEVRNYGVSGCFKYYTLSIKGLK
jgi:hypothetical protein